MAGLDADGDLDLGVRIGHPSALTSRSAHSSTAMSRSTETPVMPVVLVGAGGETDRPRVVVGDDPQALDPDRTEQAGIFEVL